MTRSRARFWPNRPTNDGQSRTAGSRPVKHSFTIAGHRTSISLEAAFWDALNEVAAAEGHTLGALVQHIDRTRSEAGLSSAVRVFLLERFRAASAPAVSRADD